MKIPRNKSPISVVSLVLFILGALSLLGTIIYGVFWMLDAGERASQEEDRWREMQDLLYEKC